MSRLRESAYAQAAAHGLHAKKGLSTLRLLSVGMLHLQANETLSHARKAHEAEPPGRISQRKTPIAAAGSWR